MSEEQYGKLVNMIGQMAEQITSNLTTKIESEIGGLREEFSAKLESEVGSLRQELKQVNQRVDELTRYTKQRIEIVERRLDNTDDRVAVVEMELRDIKARHQQQQI